MTDSRAHPYYASQREAIRKELEDRMLSSRTEFEARFPSRSFDTVLLMALQELEGVLPIVPYAGGDSGRMTPFFKLGAGVIAVGRALRSLDAPQSIIGALMRTVFLAEFYELREDERRQLGRTWLSEENKAYLREEAERSQQRENPGDFVYQFVEGAANGPEGRPFEFGLDYLECGFCKMCSTGGDEDLLPHICAMDKESYGIRGVDLQRTTTLAGGDAHCNFRFRLAEDGGKSQTADERHTGKKNHGEETS